MRERADEIGATFEISSLKGCGSEVRVVVPLPAPEEV
jgi:signal transduction histidine kinase